MTTWREVEAAAPGFAATVWRRFGMGVNKTMATLRRDGSPRISATELELEDGEITLGMMEGSLKLLDVRRDPRSRSTARASTPRPTTRPGPATRRSRVGSSRW